MFDRSVPTSDSSQLNSMLVQFSYLQVLDFLTTIAFLLNGVHEANPLVRWVMKTGHNPLGGLLAVKLLAILLGVCCWRMGRRWLLARINIVFAVVIAWNLIALIIGTLVK